MVPLVQETWEAVFTYSLQRLSDSGQPMVFCLLQPTSSCDGGVWERVGLNATTPRATIATPLSAPERKPPRSLHYMDGHYSQYIKLTITERIFFFCVNIYLFFSPE